MKRKLLAIGAAVALCPMLASAGETYIGSSIGIAMHDLNIDEDKWTKSGYRLDNKDIGYKLFIGHRFYDSLALELSFTDFGQATATNRLDTITAQSQSLAASVVGIAPITQALEVLGKAGLQQSYTSIKSAKGALDLNSTEILYGVGFNYKISSISLRAEYERYTTTRKNNDLISVGASWSF